MQNSKYKKTFNFSLLTFNYQEGQSLFELVVAIAISALIIVALVSLATRSIQNSNYSKNKARAATYAQQGIEWLRGQRDSNVDTFIANVQAAGAGQMCLNNLAWTTGSCSNATIAETPFQRYVVFAGPDVEKVIEADITVSWTDSAGLHKVTNATFFSDWR